MKRIPQVTIDQKYSVILPDVCDQKSTPGMALLNGTVVPA
jgi:hypothetical protein